MMKQILLWAALLLFVLPLAGRGGQARARSGDGTEERPVKIVSYNIRYGTADDGPDRWERRRGAVIELLRGQRPDVIGLQEALRFQIDEIREAMPGMAEVGGGRDDGRAGGEHSQILFDAGRFVLAEGGTFWLSETPRTPGSRSWGSAFPRICVWARLVDRATGAGLYVYNTHWDHVSQEARERSAAAIAAHAAARGVGADPVVILGDLNAGEENPAVAALREAGYRDAFRVLHPEAAGGSFNAFRVGHEGGEKIDYVFVSPGLEVLSAEILRDRTPEGRWPSDHFPVTAAVRPSGPDQAR